MSHMNLYIMREGLLKRATVPVFVVKDLLLNGVREEEVTAVFRRGVADSVFRPYDLGLFLVDMDGRSLVSAQLAFALDDLNGAREKISSWKYVELEHETATPELISKSIQ